MFSSRKMQSQHEKLPAFFKVYLPEFSSKGMKFPMAFTLCAQGALPDKAFLRDCYGNLWPVELARMGNDLFLLDGWVKFVEDNAIEVGEFLVFQFDGNNTFDVKLLGRSGCEKRGIRTLKSTVKEEQEEDQEKEVKKDVGVSEILSIEYNHNDNSGDDADKGKEEEEEEEEEKEQELIELSDKEVSKSKSKRSGEDIRKRSKGCRTAPKGTASGRARPVHKVRDIPDTYGAEIFNTGLHSQPKNPYFVAKVRPKRRDELYIPVDVVKDHNLDLPPTMTLRDPEGRTYSTKLSLWKDGRIWYTGGWRSLCRWNLVEAEDRCICEFVKENGKNNIFLQIQIVRAGAAGASSS